MRPRQNRLGFQGFDESLAALRRDSHEGYVQCAMSICASFEKVREMGIGIDRQTGLHDHKEDGPRP